MPGGARSNPSLGAGTTTDPPSSETQCSTDKRGAEPSTASPAAVAVLPRVAAAAVATWRARVPPETALPDTPYCDRTGDRHDCDDLDGLSAPPDMRHNVREMEALGREAPEGPATAIVFEAVEGRHGKEVNGGQGGFSNGTDEDNRAYGITMLPRNTGRRECCARTLVV